MNFSLSNILYLLKDIKVLDFVEIIIIAAIVYKLLMIIENTRAVQIIYGIIILLTPIIISPWIKFNTLIWLLTNILPFGFLLLFIIFQNEIRRALEQLGKGNIFVKNNIIDPKELSNIINQIIVTMEDFSKKRIGALIVIENNVGLADILETGILLDAKLTKELLHNIFIPNTPLHDGAVIIKNNIIRAANCYLPLSKSSDIDSALGTRHRAALGITEQVSDCIALVVSEETGSFSICYNGHITPSLDLKKLKTRLLKLYKISDIDILLD